MKNEPDSRMEFPFTFYDLAERLGVQYSIVYRLHELHRDEIPGKLIGHRWRFPPEAVEVFRPFVSARRGRRNKPEAIPISGEPGQPDTRLQQSIRDKSRTTHRDIIAGTVSSEGATADLEQTAGQGIRDFFASITYLDGTGHPQVELIFARAHDDTTAWGLFDAYARQVMRLKDFEIETLRKADVSYTQVPAPAPETGHRGR